MRVVLLLVAIFAVGALAQGPDNVLIYHDIFGGYGDAVVTAAGNLWPTANIQSYTGEPGSQQLAFNTALSSLGDGWDIVVVESWYANGDDLYWGGLNDLYDTGAIKLFASTWQWSSGGSGQGALGNAMGVSGFATFGSPVISHYAWDAGHDICSGITDWSWNDPGLGVLNCRMTVSDATPITGWTASASAGEAGICVANDGNSVISGYNPSYANEGVAIWENIFTFMWGSSGALESDTWAGIKTSF